MPKKRTSNANLFLLLINDSVSEIKTTGLPLRTTLCLQKPKISEFTVQIDKEVSHLLSNFQIFQLKVDTLRIYQINVDMYTACIQGFNLICYMIMSGN